MLRVLLILSLVHNWNINRQRQRKRAKKKRKFSTIFFRRSIEMWKQLNWVTSINESGYNINVIRSCVIQLFYLFTNQCIQNCNKFSYAISDWQEKKTTGKYLLHGWVNKSCNLSKLTVDKCAKLICVCVIPVNWQCWIDCSPHHRRV